MRKVIFISLGVIILLMDFFLILGLIDFIIFVNEIKSYSDFIIPIIMLCFAVFCFVMAGNMSKKTRDREISIQNSKVKIDNQRRFIESDAVLSYKNTNLQKLENDTLKKDLILEDREIIEEPLQQKKEPNSQENMKTIEELYSREIKEYIEKIQNLGLREVLIEKIQRGISLPQIAKEISENTGQDFETVYDFAEFESTLFHEDANFRAYEAAGIEQYQFWAEHELTVCPKCAVLDMKVFNVKDRKIGVNAPPMHCGCHCITVEYDPNEKEDYISSGLEPPEDRQTWKQWYDDEAKRRGKEVVEKEVNMYRQRASNKK